LERVAPANPPASDAGPRCDSGHDALLRDPTFVLVQDKNFLKAKRIHAYRCLPDTVDPRRAKGK